MKTLDSMARGGLAGFFVAMMCFVAYAFYDFAGSPKFVACNDAPGWVQRLPAPEWYAFWRFKHCDVRGIIPMSVVP